MKTPIQRLIAVRAELRRIYKDTKPQAGGDGERILQAIESIQNVLDNWWTTGKHGLN